MRDTDRLDDLLTRLRLTAIRDLASGRWVGHGQALLLLCPPSVGKTHLAVERGYTVLFSSAAALRAGLTKAHADGHLEEKLVQLSKPKLLIIDELGYLPLEPAAAHLFFPLVSQRYAPASVLITSNRPVGEWGAGVRRRRCRHRHHRPAAASQPGHHDPRRQLPAARQAPRRPSAEGRRPQPR